MTNLSFAPRPALAMLMLAVPAAAQLTWRQAGTEPAVRCGHFAFCDEARGRITVFQGQDSTVSYVDDCWQLDDTGWIQVAAPTAIGAPRGHGAACEDMSGGGLMFGGTNAGGTIFNQTLRCDPASLQFSVLQPALSPPARRLTAMVCDTARQRVVLFGGANAAGDLGDTWEWNGSTWTQRLLPQSPGPRSGHVMAYDAARGRVVLHGGKAGVALGDTLTYDGTTWTNVTAAGGPGAMFQAAMAYDAARAVTVLFSGVDGTNSLLGQLWEWNGTTWTQRASGPQARKLASLTYDKQRRRVTLIAGQNVLGQLLRDAWSWDGTAWQQLAPRSIAAPVVPAFERTNHAAAFASNRGRMVVYGGNHQNSTAVYNDVSETESTVWQRYTPTPAPIGRTGAKMAYDATSGLCLLFGGRGISTFSDNALWSWNGSTWTQTPNPNSTPFGRTGHAVAFDQFRRRLVMFGGNHQFGTNNETWEFDPVAGTWSQRSPLQSPSPRTGHVMAYSEPGFGTYLFGGAPGAGGYSNELWAWNGINWAMPSQGNRPPPLADAAMCSDPIRGRLVLFGGSNASGFNQEVFEHDGANWFQRTVSGPRPAARNGASLVWDSTHRRCVLHGGNAGLQYFNDVWEWDGANATWTLLPHAGVPQDRSDHVMAYDPGRRCTVLFGGNSNGRLCNDTWDWNGSAWTPHATPVTPSPRFAAAMATSYPSGQMVLFGGFDATSTALGDTWLFDGQSWYTAAGTPVVSPRCNHAMASLWPDFGVILNGGHDGSSHQGGTYLWNSTWSLLTMSGPGARDIHAMAYDQIRRKVVLFGGRDQFNNFLGDTWELDVASATWTQRSPGTAPPGRWNAAMTFDTGRGRVVMTGGYNGSYLADLWEWDGSDWLQRTPETARPPAVENSGFAYDARRGRNVWFGGNGAAYTGELWELDARIDRAGAGNTANPEALRYYSQPVLGQPLRLGFTSPQGIGFQTVGFGPLQQPLAALAGPPLCEASSLWASLVSYLVLGTAEPNIAWNVPNTPLLLGVTLVFQAFALQPANCWRATDALHVRF